MSKIRIPVKHVIIELDLPGEINPQIIHTMIWKNLDKFRNLLEKSSVNSESFLLNAPLEVVVEAENKWLEYNNEYMNWLSILKENLVIWVQ